MHITKYGTLFKYERESMNKIIVITGGTSGIGLELKRNFEKAGDRVITISTRETGDPLHYSASVSDGI